MAAGINENYLHVKDQPFYEATYSPFPKFSILNFTISSLSQI